MRRWHASSRAKRSSTARASTDEQGGHHVGRELFSLDARILQSHEVVLTQLLQGLSDDADHPVRRGQLHLGQAASQTPATVNVLELSAVHQYLDDACGK